MKARGYTALGWFVWQVGRRLGRYELNQNKAKIGAGATVLAVLVAGIVAARLATGDAED